MSMLKIRFAGNADQAGWDEYVMSRLDSWPYHLFAWREAVEEAYGKKAYYFIAEDGHEIVGILPLIYMKFPGIACELTALSYCDVGNCLCNEVNVADELLSAAIELGTQLKIDKIHLRGYIPRSDYGQSVLTSDTCDKVRMFKELPDSSAVLMKSFKSKLRSQIRKAEKNGITFRWGGLESIDDFYRVFSENMRELGSPVHSKQWFTSILTSYGERAGLGLVSVNGKTVGCGLLLKMGDKVSVPWASTLRKYNHLAPSMLLYWNLLKYSCDNGYRNFDFGRSTMNGGTYRFKYQWGARPARLDWYSIYIKGTEDKALGKSFRRQIFEKIWPKFPLALTNYLGPQIRKHISY